MSTSKKNRTVTESGTDVENAEIMDEDEIEEYEEIIHEDEIEEDSELDENLEAAKILRKRFIKSIVSCYMNLDMALIEVMLTIEDDLKKAENNKYVDVCDNILSHVQEIDDYIHAFEVYKKLELYYKKEHKILQRKIVNSVQR